MFNMGKCCPQLSGIGEIHVTIILNKRLCQVTLDNAPWLNKFFFSR